MRHPSSIIDRTASLAEGTVALANVVVQAEAQIGRHVIVNTSSSIDHESIVGDYCHICPSVRVAGNVQIGRNVTMGIDSSAIPGVTIGNNVTLGPGAVATNEIPDDCVAVGVPARIYP